MEFVGAGLFGSGVDKRGCSRTDVGAWEASGRDGEHVTGAGLGRKELCEEFAKGLTEDAGSLLECKSADPVEGVCSKAQLPEMLLLGDDKHAKRRTIMRHNRPVFDVEAT